MSMAGFSLSNNGMDDGTNASVINMTGGTIDTTTLDLNNGVTTRKIVVNLYGGTLDVSSTFSMDVDARIDIKNDGKLKVSGNVQGTINGYVGSKWITSYGGSCDVDVVYAGGYTVVTAGSSVHAYNPQPDDEDVGVDINSELIWLGGSGAVSHDVYIGTDEMAVRNADINSGELER